MSGKISRVIVGICAAFGLLALAPVAGADPTVVSKGEAQLPTTGLLVDLPARSAGVYHVSGSWSLNAATGTFDARDIIDEIDPSGNVTAGNWVLVGYFDAGECDDVLAEQKFDAPWSAEQDLWGQHWAVRGGVFTFENALGRRPAAALCRTEPDGPSLLLYRFMTSSPETLDQSAILADVKSSAALSAAARSFSQKRTRSYLPLTRTDVRNRGSDKAARPVTLPVNKLKIDLPDDGFVWLARAGDGSDMLDRMMPALPDTSLEVIAVAGEQCADVFAALDTDTKAGFEAQNLPPGWIAGPAIIVGGEVEPTACHLAGVGALIVGLIQGGNRDFAPYHQLLGALTGATRLP